MGGCKDACNGGQWHRGVDACHGAGFAGGIKAEDQMIVMENNRT
jgi:hypothetical protein